MPTENKQRSELNDESVRETLRDANGSAVELHMDSAKGEPLYVCWYIASGRMYGTAQNTEELRNFLRRTLEKLEADKNKK